MKISDNKIHRNDFATRCFRNVADYDYVVARTLFRNHCYDNFLILSQQCLEKYLKGVLLFNDVKYNKSSHSLNDLFKKCKGLDYINFSNRTVTLLNNFDGLDSIRYLTYCFSARRDYILELDQAVFDIRKFCQSNIKWIKTMNNIGEEKLKKLNQRGMVISFGELERIIRNKNKKYKYLKENLTWKNFYFGKKIKKKINFQHGYWAKNAPIVAKEDKPVYEAVRDYVYLPSYFKKLFR